MKAIIVTQNKCPCEDAGAIRQHAMAKMLQQLGWEVVVLGYGTHTDAMVYDSVEYHSFRSQKTGKLQRLISRLHFGNNVMRFLKSSEQDIKAILVVDVLPCAFQRIQKFALRKGIQLIHDSVEWYSAEEFPNGKRNLEYRLKEYTNTKAITKDWKVIGISRYLEAHFSSFCKKTICIPVVMDVLNAPCRVKAVSSDRKLRFVYAGAPGRKDYLAELLEGFSLLEEEQLDKVQIHLYGVTKEQLIDKCGVLQSVLEKLKNCLVAHGRVPREQAVQAVLNADYSMLLRDATLRYARAGFPTKIVECMSSGTIPFCNLSSDLELYLEDSKNAIIIDGHSSKAVAEAAEWALAVSQEDRANMRIAARKTAEECFDYRQYIDRMRGLIED